LAVNFSGDAAMVEGAFRTPLVDVRVDGAVRHANLADPSIPRALSTLVNGVVTLHNIPRHTFHTEPKPITVASGQDVSAQSIVVDGKRAITPGDFATIYNVKPLYTAGIDGTGVSIAVVGHVDAPKSDIINFRKKFKLPANDPVY